MWYVEIICITTPHPDRRFTIDTPRVMQVGVSTNINFTFYAGVLRGDQSFPRVREIDLIIDYAKYNVVKSPEGRHFLGFPGATFSDFDDFLRHAQKEVDLANTAIGSLLPSSAPITITTAVYEATSPSKMGVILPERELGKTPTVQVVDDPDLVARWNTNLYALLSSDPPAVLQMLDRLRENTVFEKCARLLNENTFSSYYNVFEIVREQLGGQQRLLRKTTVTKEQISRFTDNAQTFRHANHKRKTPEMTLAEAKLLLLDLIRLL